MAEGHVRGEYAERGDLAGEYRWGDAGQIVLIGIFSVVTLLDVFWLRYFPSVSGLIPWYIRIIIGIPLVVGGIQLSRLGVNIVFGEQRKKLMVIRSGVFGWVRHPVYVGMLVFFLGFVVISFSILALVVWLVMVVFYVFLSWYEEQLLVEKLGDAYRQYQKEVPMMLPRFWRKN